MFESAKPEIDQSGEIVRCSKVLLKHMMKDGRDCWLTWKIDFSQMEILLQVDFLSPALLEAFLESLMRKDARFGMVQIRDTVEMSKRFNIKVIVSTEYNDVIYKLCAYRGVRGSETSVRTEIDLMPLGHQSPGSERIFSN